VDAYLRPPGFASWCLRMRPDGWYAPRSYPHFDLPLPFDAAKAYVTDPARVCRHGFHPFLRFDIVRRRYRANRDGVEVSKKSRPIASPAHVDGYIFAYYAKVLGECYERAVARDGIGHCVLAYRSGLGSNVEFAKSAFEEIKRRHECTALALDLETFFESLGHATLKKNWAKLLGVDRLPGDHFTIYRAITRYSQVSLKECRSRLGIEKGQRTPRPICSPAVFRALIRASGSALSNLVVANSLNYGIPQGSQISALLSNLYMLDFDREMNCLAKSIGGFYGRYSDDILWICHPNEVSYVEETVKGCLAKLGGTTKINDAKSERVIFHRGDHGEILCDRPVQYLGFTFDGTNARIRSQTLSKFWRRVVYAVRNTKRAASRSATMPSVLFRRKIYRQFTHLGHRNLISYAKRSEDVMRTGAIRAQIRRHVPRIQKELNQ
jgi:RNA-directed DNA polymerase